jgi:antitoxin HigA-1
VTGKSLRHPSIRPSHPGEVVADSIAATGISKVAAAKALGVSRNTIYMLIDQRQAVTAEMALRLEAVIGSTAETWLKLQAEHDLWAARQTVDLSGLTRVA